jgi:hypothetical protein
MSSKSTASFPIFGILGLIFVTLKLAGIGTVATWSWWLVTLPFYGPVVVALGLVLVAAVFAGIAKQFM